MNITLQDINELERHLDDDRQRLLRAESMAAESRRALKIARHRYKATFSTWRWAVRQYRRQSVTGSSARQSVDASRLRRYHMHKRSTR